MDRRYFCVDPSIHTVTYLYTLLLGAYTVFCTNSSLGLFINNPVAPTGECLEYVRNLEYLYGNVKYIVLSSLAVEHKGTNGT